MNREFRREEDDPDRKREEVRAESAALADAKRRNRTSPLTFLKEVRGEMRRVAWPSRREVASYSLIVLVAVTIITAYIFGLDQLFGQFVLTIFGQS